MMDCLFADCATVSAESITKISKLGEIESGVGLVSEGGLCLFPARELGRVLMGTTRTEDANSLATALYS